MSDQSSTTTTKLRPRVAEAVKVWDSLPATDKKYKTVAEQMGITEGRAAVYVREGLVALGRGDETPRGGNASGGGIRLAEVDDFEKQLSDLVDRNREIVERLTEEVNEATEAAANFDADAYITAQAEAMQRQIEELTKRLTAWQADEESVATKAAEDETKRLNERAEKLREASDEQIVKATAAAEQAEAMLATYREQQAEAAATA